MTITGLWTVEFVAAKGSGTGVITIINDKIFGGDAAYYYYGELKSEGNLIRATVNVTRYSQGISVFGFANDHKIIVEGPINAPTMHLSGHLANNPKQKIVILCTKRLEL